MYFQTHWFRLVVSCVVLAGAGGRSAEPEVAEILARIEAAQPVKESNASLLTLPALLESNGVPAVSVAVIKDFRVQWAKAYGVADVETGAPARDTTRFQAASISKPVTAMAVLKLVQEGRLNLDADINVALKSWQVPRNADTGPAPVTLRALLSHTSGSDDGFGFPGYEPGVATPTLRQIFEGDALSNVGSVVFKRPPFAVYKYSGGGTVIVQQALTDVAERPFSEIMHETVLKPLGMHDSTYAQPLPAALDASAARAHDREGKSRTVKWHVYPEQAAAGLWTTAADLARFAIEVQTAARDGRGKVLSQASVREMLTPVGVGPFAVGLMIEKRGEGWYFKHSGGNWGFRCDLLAHVRKGYGVVVMTNGDNGGPVIAEIEARVAAAYAWDSRDKPLPRGSALPAKR